MITNFTRFLGMMPAALALNALNPSTASAQDGASRQDNAASTFNPLNFDKKGQLAGVYTGFATSVTERNDEVNHSSIPLDIPDKREKGCPNDGDVCADISKFTKTYVTDFTDYVDAIKVAKKGSEEATFRGKPFPIPPKENEENKDTLFSDDLRCYLEIYQAMDEMDGTADGIVHGIAVTKLLAKSSPERAKLTKKCDVDYFGREDNELSREIYFTTAAPLFAGLTKIAYEGPNSMVEGYVPQKVLDETQGKLDRTTDELGKNKKALENAKEDIGNLQTEKEKVEAQAKTYKKVAMGLGGFGVLMLGLLIVVGLRKSRSNTPTGGGGKGVQKSPDGEAVSILDPGAPSGTRTVKDTSAVAAPQPVAPSPVAVTPPPLPKPATAAAGSTVVGGTNEMADLAAALAAVSKDKSPAPGASPSSPPAATSITADNVIIHGADARPSAEINRTVVMAQISYLNQKFLSDDGITLHPNYRAGVEQMADLAMSAFSNRGADAPNPRELWTMEHGERGSMIRGGLPEAWLRAFVTGQLERWHAAGAPGMSFDAMARETMERDAARRANERSAYERWIEDVLCDPARLAGR